MRFAFTLAAILLALMVESAVSRLAPAYARAFDPFLIVLVYCGLAGGELHGMLAGAVAGWVQDVHFAGAILGIGGLSKLVVGFASGLAAARFLLAGLWPRLAVLFGATLLDALLHAQLAELFDVRLVRVPLTLLVVRGVLNALLGVVCFDLIERHVLPRLGR